MNIKKLLPTLSQYYFDRTDFCLAFEAAVPKLHRDELLSDYNVSTDSFHFHRNGDEFYLMHYDSGTIINWYKHLGRTNTCNNPLLLTKDDLTKFFKLYYEEWYELRKPKLITKSDTPGPDVNSTYPSIMKFQINSIYGSLSDELLTDAKTLDSKFRKLWSKKGKDD